MHVAAHHDFERTLIYSPDGLDMFLRQPCFLAAPRIAIEMGVLTLRGGIGCTDGLSAPRDSRTLVLSYARHMVERPDELLAAPQT